MLHSAGGNLLQSWGWAELKATQGWRVDRLVAVDAADAIRGALQLLTVRGPLGSAFAYAPRGPALEPALDATAARLLLAEARRLARRRHAVVLKLDPEWPAGEPAVRHLLAAGGLRDSAYDVQHRITYLVDLTGGADAVLGRIKASTRRNLRIAARGGVTVEFHADTAAVEAFYPLYAQSVRRNRFIGRDLAYVHALVRHVATSCPLAILLASVGGETVCGMVAAAAGPRLIYLLGGSSLAHSELRPAYLLHWRAIAWGLEQGCDVYDMWGVPSHEDPDAPQAGYYEFKRRWNGRVARHIRCQEAPLWPWLGPLPRLLERLALRGRPLLN